MYVLISWLLSALGFLLIVPCLIPGQSGSEEETDSGYWVRSWLWTQLKVRGRLQLLLKSRVQLWRTLGLDWTLKSWYKTWNTIFILWSTGYIWTLPLAKIWLYISSGNLPFPVTCAYNRRMSYVEINLATCWYLLYANEIHWLETRPLPFTDNWITLIKKNVTRYNC